LFGSHLSIAGGLHHALVGAKSQGMDCVQIFTKNQRRWKVQPLLEEAIQQWFSCLKDNGWENTNRVVSHNSYLVNLASPNLESRKKSIELQREEIERCEQLGIPSLVSHPGARLGTPRKTTEKNKLGEPPTKEELEGLKRIAQSIDQLHKELPRYNTKICLETTVGSGTNLGYDFQHLSIIRNEVKDPERIAFCFDTCHVVAAGYGMQTNATAESVLQEFDAVVGLQHINVFHFNDSAKAVGSRKDRHSHIGEGACGRSCFRSIVKRTQFDDIPKILETSKEANKKGVCMDLVNIKKLRSMQTRTRKRR
jgi:deoxyribonuclease-4